MRSSPCVCISPPYVEDAIEKSITQKLQEADDADPQQWFYVNVFGCALPLPNSYILSADAKYFRFYDNRKTIRQHDSKYPIWITIKDIDGQNIHPRSDEFDLRYEEIKRHDDLLYEHVTYDGKNAGFMISDGEKIIRFWGGRRALVDKIFDYCVAHPIPENPNPDLNCGPKNGMISYSRG